MQKKTGVSLIVLVITVIVMVILAGTIIMTLDNADIIERAESVVEQYNISELKNLANVAWAEAYMSGARTQEQLQAKVTEILKKQIDVTQYLISVTTRGATISPANKWITAMVDGVPIPKGFVASQATGENKKNGGLVIYEGTEAVTDANVETAKRTRNQYVWVPVPKEDFVTKFVRQGFGVTDTNGNIPQISNTLGVGYYEVEVNLVTNMPLEIQDEKYVSSVMLAEVQAMYASVREYEGFYIARYETGIDVQRTAEDYEKQETNIYSMMEKIPYTHVKLYDSLVRSVYPSTNENYGVVSTLPYGVQWDRTIAWCLETEAKDGKGQTFSVKKEHGNAGIMSVVASDFNDGAKYAKIVDATTEDPETDDIHYEFYTEPYQTITTDLKYMNALLTTGGLKVACINNIYDMNGNVSEITMETADDYGYPWISHRGADAVVDGGMAYRNWGIGDYMPFDSGYVRGFRMCLYIKSSGN